MNKDAYLTGRQSLIICLLPAALFLINGIFVDMLKLAKASTGVYLLLPVLLLATSTGLVFRKRNRQVILKQIKLFLPVLIIPILFAALHMYKYGTSIGSDSAYYYASPMHTFFSSGHFTFAEAPFVSYGDQPLATYWLFYNSEYLFAGLGALFDADFVQIVSLMHFVSNLLLALAVFVFLLRQIKFLPALLLFAAFMLLLYASHSNTRDLASTSLFRGFENKGLVFGYFYWMLPLLLIPIERMNENGRFSLLSGSILGGGAILVSGSAAFLFLPAMALAAGGLFTKYSKQIVICFFSFLAACFFYLVIYKLLETTDVYNVLTPAMTLLEPVLYEQQASYSHFDWRIWLLAVLLIAVLAIVEFARALQLAVFVAIALFVHSKGFYHLFYYFMPERTVNFWRAAILMNPFLPILVASTALLARLPQRLWLRVALLGAFVCSTMASFGSLKIPARTPFHQNHLASDQVMVRRACTPSALVLASRYDAVTLAVAQPSFRMLVGKEYFLNWQIANLARGTPERARALNVRNASLYLSVLPSSKRFAKDPGPDGLIRTLADIRPDIILVPKRRLTPANEHLFAGYDKKQGDRNVIFSRAGTCDFSASRKSGVKQGNGLANEK